MGYISRELTSSAKKIVPLVALASLWLVTFIDIFTGRLLNGKLVYFTGSVTVILILTVLISTYSIDLNKRKTQQDTKEEAQLLNPAREKEIRRRIEANANFMTLCYQCRNYDQEIQICLLESSHKISWPSEREIRINGKKYCLYWIPLLATPPFTEDGKLTKPIE
jgi:hypothetical protein